MADWTKINEMLHTLWGHCKASPDYDKRLWQDFQLALKQVQKEQEGTPRREKTS